MTQLMRTLVEKLQALPEEEQDRYAAVYLSELQSDRRWEELFARTTDEQWKKLANEAREEREKGESIPLDEFLNLK